MRPDSWRFIWCGSNQVEILVDGPSYLPRMEAAIAGAERIVRLELYWFESGWVADRFIDLLIHACQRQVCVQLLLDGLGSRDLAEADQQRLQSAGVELRLYNPPQWRYPRRWFRRDHRKLLLVDDELAFVGGTGLSDKFWDGSDQGRYWRELMVAIRGPVVEDWLLLFKEQWQGLANHSGHSTKPAVEDGVLARLVAADHNHTHQLQRSLLKHINKARVRVWFVTAYFLPSRKVRRALQRAARRGVDVRLLLAGPRTDHPQIRYAGQRFYLQQLKSGVRIYEYQPRCLHMKAVLCDRWSSIGSCNFDRWERRNLDANIEVMDEGFAGQLAAMLAEDFSQSQEIIRSNWIKRGWWPRLQTGFWAWLDRMAIRLTD